MKLYGVTEHELQAIIETISRVQYAGNLQLAYSEPKRNHVEFTLRVQDSKGPGHRLGFSGRQMVSACWHAHRDVMRKIFDKHPNARLISAFATYDGADDFVRSFERTGSRNVGSMVEPRYYREMCECR